jgi:antitoxin component of MazEF toxin-antitoxin module
MTPAVQEVFVRVAGNEFVLGRKAPENIALVTPKKEDKGVESEEEYLLTASKIAPSKVQEEKSEHSDKEEGEAGDEPEDEFAGFIVEEEVDEEEESDDEAESGHHNDNEVGSDGEIVLRSSKKENMAELNAQENPENPKEMHDEGENVMPNVQAESEDGKKKLKRGSRKQQREGSPKKGRARASKKTNEEEKKEEPELKSQDCTICLSKHQLIVWFIE